MPQTWEDLQKDILRCQGCSLCRNIHKKVPGQGCVTADLMLIGEGPGADEDLQGEAFVGAAGQLLTRELQAIGIRREQVYICNIVKCRPPNNRTPLPEEVSSCMPFLRRQFLLVRPKVILLLGATAAKATLGEWVRITRDRGKWVEKKGVWFMPTYHPAALLRDTSKKKDAWEDLKMVRKKLDELKLYPIVIGEHNEQETGR